MVPMSLMLMLLLLPAAALRSLWIVVVYAKFVYQCFLPVACEKVRWKFDTYCRFFPRTSLSTALDFKLDA
jgi:hypothetical protein